MGTTMRNTTAAAAAAILLTSCGASSNGANNDDEVGADGFAAQVMCEQFVEDRLKAPATAEFSDQANEAAGKNRWRVTGNVDAENGFGAKLRMSYECDMKYLGDDKWRAKSVAVRE